MENILSPTFWGVIFCYFWDFRGVNIKFSIFDPQKALPYPKRHLPVYFMKLSDKRCRLHPGSRTPQKKNAIEDVYVGCLPESDPLCKCYETWHGGSYRVRNRSDRCWSTPVNRFRCVATPKLSQTRPIGLTAAVPATTGTRDHTDDKFYLYSPSGSLWIFTLWVVWTISDRWWWWWRLKWWNFNR